MAGIEKQTGEETSSSSAVRAKAPQQPPQSQERIAENIAAQQEMATLKDEGAYVSRDMQPAGEHRARTEVQEPCGTPKARGLAKESQYEELPAL